MPPPLFDSWRRFWFPSGITTKSTRTAWTFFFLFFSISKQGQRGYGLDDNVCGDARQIQRLYVSVYYRLHRNQSPGQGDENWPVARNKLGPQKHNSMKFTVNVYCRIQSKYQIIMESEQCSTGTIEPEARKQRHGSWFQVTVIDLHSNSVVKNVP